MLNAIIFLLISQGLKIHINANQRAQTTGLSHYRARH